MEPERRRPDLLGVFVLLGLVALGLLAWWLGPTIIGVIKHQDCVGSGRMDC